MTKVLLGHATVLQAPACRGQRWADEMLSLADMEARHIAAVLDRVEGNQTQAAKILGISRSTLWRKMGEYGLNKSESPV